MIKLYKLTDNDSVIRLADGAYIPCDIGNRDYQDYLNWVAAGNVAEAKYTDIEILANSKATALTTIYNYFCTQRDATTWVTQTDGTVYGYDRGSEDVTNFLAARERAKLGIETYYKVYVGDLNTKSMVLHTEAMFNACLVQAAQEQITAYVTFATKKAEIEACTTSDELTAVDLSYVEG